MNKLLMVRIAITLLVLAIIATPFLVPSANFGFSPNLDVDGPVFPVKPLPEQSLPEGLQAGDHIDLSRMTVRDRLALIASPRVGDSISLAVLDEHNPNGYRTLKLKSVVAPQRYEDLLFWAIVAPVFVLLGLLLLWRGQDRVAAGLGVFALLTALVAPIWNMPVSPPWNGLIFWLLIAVLFPLRTISLYWVVRGLFIESFPNRLRQSLDCLVLAALVVWVVMQSVSFGAWVFKGIELHIPISGTGWGYLPAVVVMVLGYHRADAAKRLQARWIIFGFALYLLLFLISDDRELEGPIKILYMSVFMACGLVLAYAALRTRLVKISFVINRALVFSVVAALIVGVFAVVEHAIAAYAMGKNAGMALHLLVPLALGIVVHKIHGRVEHVVDRLFFRRQYEAERAIEQLGRRSGFMESADALAERTVNQLLTHLGATRVALYERTGQIYQCIGEKGNPVSADVVDTDDEALVALRAGEPSVDLSSVASTLGKHGMVIPVSVAGQIHGALVCGERVEQYSPDERKLLRELGRDIGIALQGIRARASEKLIAEIASGSITAAQLRKIRSMKERSV